ncbi:MAG: M24 family metallopeptidase [Patescibacteria group bacterium]|jgi:Xaa-Pro aminopeptidase
MSYGYVQVKSHIKACKRLDKIIGEVFKYLKANKSCSEHEVQQFILKRFGHYQLETDKDRTPIVAFGKNTADIHHYPAKKSSKRLKPDSLIMIDIWARLDKKGAVFSDITWMAWYGKKIPAEVMKVYDLVISARDNALKYIKLNLKNKKFPQGRETDLTARNIIARDGHAKRFLHTTGHSLGLNHPHGVYKGIRTDNRRPLKINIPYTIEPGVYLKNEFGVRSEINFYITSSLRLKITTKRQKNMVLLG